MTTPDSDSAPKPAKARGLSTHERSRAWIAGGPVLALSLATALAGSFGCSAAAGAPGEAEADTAQAIYGGTLDNDASQNGAVVSLKIGDSTQQFELCSGSLIAPNMVLTARHCVSVNVTTSVACDENGLSGNGDQLGADNDPATIHVFTGAQPNLLGTPVANGKSVFHSQSTILCNNDLAILVLDRPITTIKPIRVRLAKAMTSGETLRSVGYGQNDKMLPVGTRLRKDNVGVLAVGKIVSTNQTALATNEFEVGLSICQGDSGGPAISEATGAVVGVVSRGGQCTDTFGHIYTSLAGFKSIFDQAAAAAGTSYTEESAAVETPDAGGGSGSGSTSGNGASGSGGESGGTVSKPVNLRTGAGNNCSSAGAPPPERTALGGIALGALFAIGMFAARRRRRDWDE